MKNKGLIGRMKDSFIYQELARAGKILRYSPKHSTLGTALFLGGSLACGDGPIEPEIDEMPRITSSYLSPTSGMAPLSVDAGLRCEDDKGIKEYTITKGSEIIKRTAPIDTTLTYTESGMGDLSCTDTGGQKVHYRADINVTPQPTRSFSQYAVVPADSLSAEYNATAMENVDNVKVKVQRDGSPIDSMMIEKSQIPFTQTYNIPGSYRFISDIPELKPDTVTAAVKDYDPAPDLSTIPADSLSMNEGGSKSIDLESVIKNSDPNPGDNPVVIDSVTPSNGKIQASRNDYIVNAQALGENTGAYGVNLWLTNSRGKTSKAILQGGQIYDLLDVAGNLGNSETSQPVPGIVKVYNFRTSQEVGYDSSEVGYVKLLDSIPIDASGKFSEKLEHRVADLTEDIIIRGRWIENQNDSSFIRTVKLPAKDHRGLELRVVPCAPYCANPEEFKKFMIELAGSSPNTRFDFNGEYIPGFQGFQGVEILDVNPFGAQYGTITSEQQANIKNKILDQNDISGIIGEYIIDSTRVLMGSHGNYTLDSTTQEIIPNSGWVIVSPKSNMAENGLTRSYGSGTLVSRGTIYLKPGAGDGTISHEFGHVFIGSGHPTFSNQTAMDSLTTLSTTGPADKKAGKIIYEPTFMVFPPGKFPNVDNLDNLLGLKF